MQRASFEPGAQIFVCVNRRPPGDPLGEGCGDRGDALYAALKDEVGRRGVVRSVAVTRTYCLGQCPRRGTCAVVSAAAASSETFVEVEAHEAAALLALAAPAAPTLPRP